MPLLPLIPLLHLYSLGCPADVIARDVAKNTSGSLVLWQSAEMIDIDLESHFIIFSGLAMAEV
jgi:hypothetical protein